MWLDEQDSKELLRLVGVSIPPGALASSAEEAVSVAKVTGLPAYVKALAPVKARAQRGGILRVEALESIAEAFERATSALGASQVRVEKACEAGKEWYLSVGLFQGQAWPRILFSKQGGTGVEAGASSGAQLAQVAVDPQMGFRPFHMRRLAQTTNISDQEARWMSGLIDQCYHLVLDYDATLVELNPVGIAQAGPIAIDARIIIDDYSLYRQPYAQGSRSAQRKRNDLDEDLRAHGLEYVRLGGGIGVLGLGAGLTMHLVDWIDELNGSSAFFLDGTASAVRDWPALFSGEFPQHFAEDLAYGLELVGGQASVLLVNFTSGGTPVDGLTRALLHARAQVAPTLPTVIHVGGNRSQEASAVLREREDVIHAGTLGEAVRAAVGLESRCRL